MEGGNRIWWQEGGEELFETGEFSDAKIIIDYPGESPKQILVHKCLIHLVSPVWSSAVKWATNNEIRITQYPYSVIYNLIKCAYVGKLEIHSIDHCLGIIRAADFYCMTQPLEFCNQFVQQYFSKGDVNLRDLVNLFNTAVMLNQNTIRMYCFAYIEVNTKQFLFSEEFLELSLDAIITLIRVQNYMIDENTLIRSALRWCQHHCADRPLKQFVTENEITKHFRWETLTVDERNALISDYPGVFQGEPIFNLTYNAMLAANDARGEPNEQHSCFIVVRGPPCVVVENFTYFGEQTVLPIASIQLAPRHSSIDHSLSKAFEDKFTIQILDRIIEFDGPLSDSSGTTVIIPPPALSVPLTHNSEFSIVITLQRTGVYYKNSKFLEYGQGLFRNREGIIQKIHSSYEPPSSSSSDS